MAVPIVIASAGVSNRAQLSQLFRGRRRSGARIVQVDQLGVFVDHAVVRLISIKVLYQVIPHVPFPNDLASLRALGLDFDYVIWPQVILKQFGIAALRDGFFFALAFPCDHQHVAVGQ